MSARQSSPYWNADLLLRRIFTSRRRRSDLLQSGLFDREWYLRTYDDVRSLRQDPMTHFLRIGSAEGRSPGPSFDTRQYLVRYRDVADSGAEPWRHYYMHGRSENRIANSSDEFRAALEMIKTRLSDLENNVRLVLSEDLPVARLARLERISAQWQASVPRLLDRMKIDDIENLRERVNALESRVKSSSISQG